MTAKAHRATTWPLLRKDLTEMAAQGKTYWVRGLAVVAVYAVFASIHFHFSSRFSGRELFGMFNFCFAAGVMMFAPMAMASVIAGEKERGGFALLMVTPLTPWELLLQKYLARVIPVLGLILCLLPVYAVCYSSGGIDPDALAGAAALQVVGLLQAGAVGLCMSCVFRSTMAATLAGWLFYATQYLLAAFLHLLEFDKDICMFFFAPCHCARAVFDGRFVDELWRFACLGGTTLLLLLAARGFVLTLAFPSGGNRRIGWIRCLMVKWRGLGVRSHMDGLLSAHDAFRWRELHRLGLASPEFNARIIGWSLLLLAGGGLPLIFLESDARWKFVTSVQAVVCPLAFFIWIALGVAAAHVDRRQRGMDIQSILPGGHTAVLTARTLALGRLSMLLLPFMLALPAWEFTLEFFEPPLQGLEPRTSGMGLLGMALIWLVIPRFLVRLGLYFGQRSVAPAIGLLVSLGILISWSILGEAVTSWADERLQENFNYITLGLRPSSHLAAFMEASEGAIDRLRAISSPVSLPMRVYVSLWGGTSPGEFLLFTSFYWLLGTLLLHRTLHRVRRRYG